MNILGKGNKVNIYTLLNEIDDFKIEVKDILKELYDYIYLTLEWSHKPIRSNKTQLYTKIEKVLKSKILFEE